MTRTAVTVPLAELRMKARRHAFMRAQHKNLLIFLLGLLVGLEFFENGMFIFGANYIMGGVDAAPEEFVRAQASYAVGSLITIVLQQRLTMRFGYKRFLLATIVLFMGGLWGCAKSNSIDQMVLARLVLGAGGGAFFTSSRILITLMFPLSERFRASLWYAVCLIGASAVAPAFAAWVIETWDWSMVFYSVMPATIVTWIGVWLFIPNGVGRLPGLKFTGTLPMHRTIGPLLLFILAVACLQLAVSEARLDVLAHPVRLTLLIATGVLLLAGFLLRQWNHPQPLLSLRLFHNPTYWVGLGVYALHYGFISFGSYLFPMFAQQGLGIPLRATGWLNSFSTAVTVLVTFIFIRFVALRFKHMRPTMLLGLASLIVAALWFAGLSANVAQNQLFPGLIAWGMFGTLLISPAAGLTFRDLSDHHFGHGYQGKNILRQIVSSAGSALAAVALQGRYYALQEKITGQLDPARPDVAQWAGRAGGWFAAHGFAPGQAHSAAMATLQQMINTQAMLLAGQDMYRWLAAAALAAMVFIIVQRRLP